MEVLETFPCEKCGKTFDYIYALKRHWKHCGALKPRKCRKCLKLFKDQSSASEHEITCFSDNKPLTCKFCSKVFEHLYNLQRHYRGTHHIKMSQLKEEVTSGRFIEFTTLNSEEGPLLPLQYQNINPIKPSIYTIEIENISNIADSEPSGSVQTLVYKILETPESSEIQLLPEPFEESEYQEDQKINDWTENEHYEENDELGDIVFVETDDGYAER